MRILRLCIAVLFLCGLSLISPTPAGAAEVPAICDGGFREVPGGGTLRGDGSGYLDAHVQWVGPGQGNNGNSIAIIGRGLDSVTYITLLRPWGNWTNYWWRQGGPTTFQRPSGSTSWNPSNSTYDLLLWVPGADGYEWIQEDVGYWLPWRTNGLGWSQPASSYTATGQQPYSSRRVDIIRGNPRAGGYQVFYRCYN